ncbi:acetyltransferase [Heyndrickxia sporothermodurans]|nr:acetyltransferase [Heyndrickxia sporothermodurans]
MNIRIGEIKDIKQLATVHYESWISTYKGIFSKETIEKRTYETVLEQWRPRLENKAVNYQCFLAETAKGEIVAFAECGKERTEKYGVDGELYTIYMLEAYQGKGIGKSLFYEVVEFLKEKGFQSFMLWVLKDNHSARRFYEKLGGELIAEKLIGDTDIVEVAYSWKNL